MDINAVLFAAIIYKVLYLRDLTRELKLVRNTLSMRLQLKLSRLKNSGNALKWNYLSPYSSNYYGNCDVPHRWQRKLFSRMENAMYDQKVQFVSISTRESTIIYVIVNSHALN